MQRRRGALREMPLRFLSTLLMMPPTPLAEFCCCRFKQTLDLLEATSLSCFICRGEKCSPRKKHIQRLARALFRTLALFCFSYDQIRSVLFSQPLGDGRWRANQSIWEHSSSYRQSAALVTQTPDHPLSSISKNIHPNLQSW